MVTRTHITFAEFIYLLILTATGVSLSLLNALVVAVGSVLPDIDTTASLLGRKIPVFPKWLERTFGHRTLTHSVACVAGLAIFLFPLYTFNPQLYVCFLVGYASHPLLDTATISGVKLFYPFSNVKCVFPIDVNTPHRYRIQTGSKADAILWILLLIGCAPTFLIAFKGYGRFIRETQQNIESAVRDYNEFSRDHLVLANIAGYNMATKEPVNGVFEIAGALNAHTLVFKGQDAHLHSIGKEFQADYVANTILCNRGTPARSYERNIDMSNRPLSGIAGTVDTSQENYLFGELTTADRLSLPERIDKFSTISGSSGTIIFSYATYNDILDLNLQDAVILRGILTVKTVEDVSGSAPPKDPDAPPRERYIIVTLDPKESIEFLKLTGDTVAEHEIIAKKHSGRMAEDAVGLNNDQIRILELRQSAFDAESDQRIASAGKIMQIDSTEYLHNVEFFRAGYISEEVLEASDLKLKKDRQNLTQQFRLKSDASGKSGHEILKLRLANEQLEEKRLSGESSIRSTSAGILTDIHQIQHAGKTQVTFVIRKIP